MPEIIVKGVDSADAMEQLEKLLGKDAMILKTVRRDGMVEITGTNDPAPQSPAPRPAAQSAKPAASEPFSHILAETLKKQHARDIGASMDPTPLPTPQPTAATPHPTEQAAPQATHQPHQQSGAFRMPQTGYLLVGPKGAGKSTLAMQIASNLVQHGAPRPRLVFLGNGSRADGAYLAAKSQIMGLTMIHSSDADLAHPDMFNPTSDIIVVSNNRSLPIYADVPALSGFSTMLVMPAGLSATGAGRVFAAWPDVVDIVFATNDTQPWSQDDQTQANSAMRRVIAISDQSRILNALSAPKPLSHPERAPTPPKPQACSKNAGAAKQIAKNRTIQLMIPACPCLARDLQCLIRCHILKTERSNDLPQRL